MDVNEALDAMRADVPGCSLVAFADLSSRLVLSSSAAKKPGQEEMDRLSEAAFIALDGALAEGAAPVLDAADDQLPGLAMLMTSAEARVIMRSPEKPSEALVCVCAPDADLARVLESGRQTLGRIAEA